MDEDQRELVEAKALYELATDTSEQKDNLILFLTLLICVIAILANIYDYHYTIRDYSVLFSLFFGITGFVISQIRKEHDARMFYTSIISALIIIICIIQIILIVFRPIDLH